ncbi:MAG: glycoside hydrolase family 3 C-terminal domain-containing protein [Anaerolineae bacterium]|nr:glycoside hydrolase family 3 C-terminal domain-containing protein [Anaerolineae bacterium]
MSTTNKEQRPAYHNPQLPVEQRVTDLLDRMTIGEKVAQLQTSFSAIVHLLDEDGNFNPEKAKGRKKENLGAPPRKRRGPKEMAEFNNAIQKYSLEDTRLGIPFMTVGEALHGHMAAGGTIFPQAIGLASTWDVELVEQVYTVAAAEMRARGVAQALTPVLGLAREPRWGRTEETYGEDPYLVSRMGVACVRGLQGRRPTIGRQHVVATPKHYAVHSQPEAGTNSAPGNYSERTIRETFLVPFKAAVTEAGAKSIMASYNEIDGIPAHANKWLLHQVLCQEWGFRGFVTSDGGGIGQLASLHHVAADRAEAAKMALEAGIDLELDSCFAETLARQVEEGKIAEATLDRAVARVLRVKFEMGLFENPYVDPDYAERLVNCAEHRQLALKAAHKAIVLLKNEGNLLPLERAKIKSIAVIGPNAADVHLGGYSAEPEHKVSILEGIRNKVGETIEVAYAEGCKITTGVQGWESWYVDEVLLSAPEEDTPRIAEAIRVALAADVAIVAVGGNESTCREAWHENHLGDRDSLGLLGRQDELVQAIAETGTPTVVVLINGRPLTINAIAKHVPAILEGWYLGQETGTAVADVLFGDVNPGGKLPITFPRSVGQLPTYYYQKPSGKRGYLLASKEPLFPFGHGLSYTTFAYDNLQVSPPRIGVGGQAVVSVDVTNSGEIAGDEVVQLYIRDQVSSVTRPVKELKGFERVALKPGETKTVTFTITPEDLSFLDVHMERIVEPGLFDIMVGTSSVQLDTVVLEVVGK